jgi:hypothetical protein
MIPWGEKVVHAVLENEMRVMNTTTTAASAPSAQPINQAAVVDAALRTIYFVYDEQDFTFADFARAIEENPEAKGELQDLLWCASGSGEDEDVLSAFGIGMVSGMLYAASTGVALKVPPLAELKAALTGRSQE